MTFGIQLKKARKHRGLTQEELAFELGLESGANISMYENGHQEPELKRIPMLCKILDVDANFLFSDEDIPKKQGVALKKKNVSPNERFSYEGFEWIVDTENYFGNSTWKNHMLESAQVFFDVLTKNPPAPPDIQRAAVRLRAAFEARFIRIERVPRNENLENLLCQKFELLPNRVLVVNIDMPGEDSAIQSMIGSELVAFVASSPHNDVFPYTDSDTTNIAVTHGMTMLRFIENIRPSGHVYDAKKFVALTAIKDSSRGNPERTANAIASRLGSKFPSGKTVHMPFIESGQQSDVFNSINILSINDPRARAVAEIIDALKSETFNAYLSCMRIDSKGRPIARPSDGGNTAKTTSDLYEKLKNAGKWDRFGGEICGVALDKQGNFLEQSNLYCSIHPSIYQEMVQLGKPVWLIGAGKERFISFHTALNAKIVNGIVVTRDLADALLSS